MCENTNLFIIDTDAGVDDAGALILALNQDPETTEILGITTVSGNVSCPQAVANVSRILRLVHKSQLVPVFAGASKAMIWKEYSHPNTMYQGMDGLGDVPDFEPKLMDSDFRVAQNNEWAANALIRLCKLHPGKVTLVCLGPLTNVALALKLDSQFSMLPKNLYLMGGNLWEKGRKWLDSVGFEFAFCDEAACGIALNPKLILESKKVRATVELTGTRTRGQVAIEWSEAFPSEHRENVEFVTKYDSNQLGEMMTAAVSRV